MDKLETSQLNFVEFDNFIRICHSRIQYLEKDSLKARAYKNIESLVRKDAENVATANIFNFRVQSFIEHLAYVQKNIPDAL